MIRRKTYQEPSFFNASETDWTYADIKRFKYEGKKEGKYYD